MPRKDEEGLRNGARTVAALKGRGAHVGGGRNPGRSISPQRLAGKLRALRAQGKQVPSFWDHDDDDQLDDGDNVTEFQKYPAHVYPWGRERFHIRVPELCPHCKKMHAGDCFVEVNSEEEETEAMAKGTIAEREDDKRARLLAIGEVKGLKLDKRYSIDKLEACIIAAGYDATLDPSK